VYSLKKPSPQANRQSIFNVKICINFAAPIVDAATAPLGSTALRVSINTRLPPRPRCAMLPRPAIVKAEDGTLLNLLTPLAKTCSKTKSQEGEQHHKCRHRSTWETEI
jgi:hypothetical protein